MSSFVRRGQLALRLLKTTIQCKIVWDKDSIQLSELTNSDAAFDQIWFLVRRSQSRPSRFPSTDAANKEGLDQIAIAFLISLSDATHLSSFTIPSERPGLCPLYYAINMAAPAPTPRFAEMARDHQALLINRFINWIFTLPGNHGVTTGGQGQGQRAIAAGNWQPVPGGVMATGGEGIVHIWCDVDPNNQRILDRIVVKNVVSGSIRYQDRNNWHDRNVGGEPLECRQANEVWSATTAASQQHIHACLGWGGVVPTTTPQVIPQTYQYKLYHEYCAHKNLNKIMKNQPKRKRPGTVRRGRRQFPEPFLWYMFESLAKACVGMDVAYNNVGVVHQ